MLYAWRLPFVNDRLENQVYAGEVYRHVPQVTRKHLSAVWLAKELTGQALIDVMGGVEDGVAVQGDGKAADLTTALRQRVDNGACLRRVQSIYRDEYELVLEFRAPLLAISNALEHKLWNGDYTGRDAEQEELKDILDRAKAPGGVYLGARIAWPLPAGFVQTNVGLDCVHVYWHPKRSKTLSQMKAKREERAAMLMALAPTLPDIVDKLYGVFAYEPTLKVLLTYETVTTPYKSLDMQWRLLEKLPAFERLAKMIGRAARFKKVYRQQLVKLVALIPEFVHHSTTLESGYQVAEFEAYRKYLIKTFGRYCPGRYRKQIKMLRDNVAKPKERK